MTLHRLKGWLVLIGFFYLLSMLVLVSFYEAIY